MSTAAANTLGAVPLVTEQADQLIDADQASPEQDADADVGPDRRLAPGHAHLLAGGGGRGRRNRLGRGGRHRRRRAPRLLLLLLCFLGRGCAAVSGLGGGGLSRRRGDLRAG